jgi:mannose-1-phosphate guanylyltransferase
LPLWNGRTLLELTVERLRPLIPVERLLVVTGAHLAEATAALLPELPGENLVIEPSARNTLPCVVLAAALAAAREPDAVLGIFSADHFVADAEAFREACRWGAQAARAGQIATLGIAPSRPETGFGYIRAAAGQGPVRAVERFVEKPDGATAERYLAEGGYFWNAGIFFLSVATLQSELSRQRPTFAAALEAMREALGRGDAGALSEAFGRMEPISIDYGIMEAAQDVAVVPAAFGWSDVGHWGALDEVLPSDSAGNVTLGKAVLVDTREAVVVNQDDGGRMLAVVGLEGVVVVQTSDATLVLPKAQAQRVREVIAALRAQGRDDLL